MKRKLMQLGAALSVFVLAVIGCSQADSDPKASAQAMTHEQLVERGRHLITVSDCSICHSPKVMTEHGPMVDSSLLLSGYRAGTPVPSFPADLFQKGEWAVTSNAEFTAWAGPWGISFAANLTPSQVYGSGAWTEDAFIDAMRNGKHLGMGREIMPPMPWNVIGMNTDDDLKAMFAFLQSIKPIDNEVPMPVPPSAMGEHQSSDAAHK